MLNAIEKYRYTGELHRQALHQLPKVADLTRDQINHINKAARLGWWLGIGSQLPVVIGSIWLLENKLGHLKAEKKAGIYIIGIWAYGMYYMVSKAWAWHYAFSKVEHIVQDYVLTADIEEIKRIQQEKELGISAKNNQIYLPKDN